MQAEALAANLAAWQSPAGAFLSTIPCRDRSETDWNGFVTALVLRELRHLPSTPALDQIRLKYPTPFYPNPRELYFALTHAVECGAPLQHGVETLAALLPDAPPFFCKGEPPFAPTPPFFCKGEPPFALTSNQIPDLIKSIILSRMGC